MKKIFFLVFFLSISFLKSDDLESSKEFGKVKAAYLDLCKHFTCENITENPYLSKLGFYQCEGKFLHMLLCFDNVFFYRSVNFELKIDEKNNINSLKQFNAYKTEDFFRDIYSILFNKEVDLENYKLISKERDNIAGYVPGWRYVYEYLHNNKKIWPEIKYFIKISDQNQLLEFNWYGIPKFKEKKVVLNKDQAIEILRKEFRNQLNEYSKYYIFYDYTIKEQFNNLVYAVPSKAYLKEGYELPLAYSIEKTYYETLQAELSYEMEFTVKGKFASGGPNQIMYNYYTPKIITDWYLFSTPSNYEYTYTFRLWLDPETGKYNGMTFKSNSSPYDQDIKKYFWEDWIEDSYKK